MAAARAPSQHAVRARAPAGTRPDQGVERRAASAGPGRSLPRPGLRLCTSEPPYAAPRLLTVAESGTVGSRCPLSFTEVGAYVLKLQHHSEMEKRAAGSVSLISRGALYAVFQWRERKISTLAVFRLHSSSFERVASSTWGSPPTPTPQIN